MRYRLQSVDELRVCLCRIPDGIRVEVERGLAMSAETVADLRSLSTLLLCHLVWSWSSMSLSLDLT